MFCQKCGSQLNEGAAFCPKCGTKIDVTSGVRMQGTSENNIKLIKPKKSKRGLIILSIVVVLIVGIWGVIYFRNNSDPTRAIKKALSESTWVASFGGGSYECRLHFSVDSSEKGRMLGSAMLINRDKDGVCFEIIYVGEVEFLQATDTGGTIMLTNTLNVSIEELHDMLIQYTYDPKTKELSLSSDFLTDILTSAVELEFTTQMDRRDYYKNIGEKVYTWREIFN